MADSQGQAKIRGLDIDKTVKGFALQEFIFKNAILNSDMSGDKVRWYKETTEDITAESPSRISDVPREANFHYAEHSWTRNESYFKKYAIESYISEEDELTSDIQIVTRTLLRLTRAVAKQVDSDIFDVITESQSPSEINSITTTSTGGDQWDGSSPDPIKDINKAIRLIEDNNYDIGQAELWLNPKDREALLNWLISTKGSSIPEFASSKVENRELMRLMGLRVRTSVNVKSDYAVVLVPRQAATWYSLTQPTSVRIPDEGKGTKYRVYERGVAALTDPGAVTLIQDTQA